MDCCLPIFAYLSSLFLDLSPLSIVLVSFSYFCYLLRLLSLFMRWAHLYLNLLVLGVIWFLPIVLIDILQVFVHAHLRSEPIYTSLFGTLSILIINRMFE